MKNKIRRVLGMLESRADLQTSTRLSIVDRYVSATVLHGDWRVVPPLRGATYHLKGDPGKLTPKLEHPYRRSSQNGDSVEAPDSAAKGGGRARISPLALVHLPEHVDIATFK